jgi:hypothetical protein
MKGTGKRSFVDEHTETKQAPPPAAQCMSPHDQPGKIQSIGQLWNPFNGRKIQAPLIAARINDVS